MNALLLWCILVWGFSALAASMSKHQRDIFVAKVPEQKTRIFQITGWVILTLAAILAIFYKGASVGLSEWIGVMSFAALLVGLTLTYFPKKLFQLNIVIAVLFIIVLVLRLV